MSKSTKSLAVRQGRIVAPGFRLRFNGFLTDPDRASFSFERWADCLYSVEIVNVPVEHRPETRGGWRRTKRWAEKRALECLEAPA